MARNTKILAAAALLSLFATTSTGWAGSVTQPGETIGVPVGAPLPQGVYFVDTGDWGCRNTSPATSCLGVDIPLLAWSTPWTILGARLQFLVATPFLEAGVENTSYQSSFYNPFFGGQLAWDLGNGFGVSYLLGGYAGVDTTLGWSSGSLNQRFAVSYTGNGWDLTAHVIYGYQFDHVTDSPQVSPCPSPFALNGCNPNFVNLDLTATKKFGKWEIGPVAFGSWDVSSPIAGYLEQSQFAIGGLVGYDFGPVILQAYVTTDVYEKNYGGYDTRGWARVIIPLWTPAAPTPPLIRKD